MKSTGIVRQIDELGRIVLPKELRNTLNIKIKDGLEISLEGTRIIIKKHDQGCVTCGSRANLKIFKNKQLCSDCIVSLKV